jgi:anti-sigma factor RsiW
MNCSDITTLTPLYLAGELDSARADGFAAHLRGCPACRSELEQQTAFDEMLRASMAAESVDSSRVDRRVRASISAGHRTSRRRMIAAASFAAVLPLAAALGYWVMASSRAKPIDAAAARDHRMEIVDGQPRKWFTDDASIQGLTGRVGLPTSVVAAFTPLGYHLAQGKLCFLNGHVFLHLVYKGTSGNFSLFLRRSDDSASSGIRTNTFAAQHVAGFQHSALSALIVTEQPRDSALRLAKYAETIL